MTTAAAADTKKVSNDTSLIKEYTMKIVEQLAKQDEILEQIAWIRAVVSQRSAGHQERTLMMDKYLDSITDYAGSVCGDSVSDDVAEEMHRLSLEAPTRSGDSSNILLNPLEPPSFLPDDTPDSMTIVIGNTHRLVTPQPTWDLSNKHLWSFYLQASGEEVIHEIRVYLVSAFYIYINSKFEDMVLMTSPYLKHPTFWPSELILRSSPYKVTRIGWGHFTIGVTIVLKPGYLWQKGNSRFLRLEWELDFNGFGSSAYYEYAVTS
jgi:hypothetical protein